MIEARRIEPGSPFYEQELALRDKVLRQPLGRPSAREDRDRDETGSHFVAVEGGKVIACLGLYANGEGAILRHMAVDPEKQGKGVGRMLVAFAEEWAKETGVNKIEAEARLSAIGFYQHCGFCGKGGEYIRHGVSHRKAQKTLTT